MTLMGFKKGKGKKTLNSYENQLWKVISEYIRRKYADQNGFVRCFSCGLVRHWKEVDCGHLISRGFKYTKYLESNLGPQCKGCNGFKQGDYSSMRAALVRIYGEKQIAENEERKRWKAGFTIIGLQLKIDEYKRKIKEL